MPFGSTYQGISMTKLISSAIALSISLAFSAGAIGQTMTQEQYRFGKEQLASDYKRTEAACDSYSGNAKDICKAEASGGNDVARAQLDARFQPSPAANLKVSVAKADAAFAIAKEKCDDMKGKEKEACQKAAKDARDSAKKQAKSEREAAEPKKQAKTKKDS